MLVDEARALHEHAARPAGRVEDLAVEGLDDLDDQPDDRGRCEVLAALLTLGDRELAEEVLVDLAEGVALDVPSIELMERSSRTSVSFENS